MMAKQKLKFKRPADAVTEKKPALKVKRKRTPVDAEPTGDDTVSPRARLGAKLDKAATALQEAYDEISRLHDQGECGAAESNAASRAVYYAELLVKRFRDGETLPDGATRF